MQNFLQTVIDWFVTIGEQLPIVDPVLVFGLVMLIIFTAPLLFRRFRIPGIIGLILFGAFVGPSALGLLDRDATMVLLGTVGLIYLMFTAGLSIDLNQFNRMKTKSLIFGLFSFFIPQLIALWVGPNLLGYDMKTSLLLGSIVGSHTLLAYPIARRLGITKNKSVTMAMGGSIVTDLISLVLLAVVMTSMTGELTTVFWLKFVLMLVLYGVGVMFLLPQLGRWFFKNVQNESSTEYAFLLCCLFVSAALAQAIGLAPIIGAFLAGMALNRLIPESGSTMLRIQFVGDALLVPFFLISVGMLVDFKVLVSSWEVWILAATFTAIVIIGKFGAAKVAQLLFRQSIEEFGVVAGLTIPQAAATLAVTLVGFELGLFSQNAVNAVIVMILVTCIIGPLLVENYGRRLALQDDDEALNASVGHQRVLVPLANPSTATSLIDLAMLIRDTASVEPMYPLIVARDGDDVQAQVANSEKMLGHAVIHAAAANIAVQPVTRVDLNIANGIIRAVKELRISAVVIGWNGQVSAQQRIFGSVLDQMLSEVTQMIFVSKLEQPVNTNDRIILIVPPLVEREAGFIAALRAIKILSVQIGTPIHLYTVESSAKRISEINRIVRPFVDVKTHTTNTWNGLIADVMPVLGANDLCVLFNVKEGAIGWQPGLNRLPRALANRQPNMNFITVYPAESEADLVLQHRPLITGHGLSRILDPEYCTFGLDGPSVSQAIHQMMHRFWSDDLRILEELKSQVMQSMRDHVPELTRGVLLLHAHNKHVDKPLLLMGIHPTGLELSELDHRIHILFILFSPLNRSPQEHLQNLANIARMVSSEEVVKKMMGLSNKDELRILIEEADQS